MIYSKWFNIINATIFASLPLTCVLVCKLSVTALLPCLPVCCRAPCCNRHGLTLWYHKPQKTLSFYKLTMVLCYDNRKVTKIDNYDRILLVYAQFYTTVKNNWGVKHSYVISWSLQCHDGKKKISLRKGVTKTDTLLYMKFTSSLIPYEKLIST